MGRAHLTTLTLCSLQQWAQELGLYMIYVKKGNEMYLTQMKVGDVVSVDSINIQGALKHRLNSLGLARNSEVCIKNYGWFKSTVQIMIDRTLIALRKDEAELIEVHKI